MLSVYIWFQGPHLKFKLTPDDEVLFFDGASNLVAKISADVLLRQLAHAMNGLALETLMREELTPPKPLAAMPPRRLTADLDDMPDTPTTEERAALRRQRHSRKRNGFKVLATLAGAVLLALLNHAHVDSKDAMFTLWEEEGVWCEY